MVRRVCSADSSHFGPAPRRARRSGHGPPTRIPVEEGPPGPGKGSVRARHRTAASELRPPLTGTSDRDHLVDRTYYKQVYKDQGWLAPVVLVDGRVAGTWSYERQPRKLRVEVKMFTAFNRETRTKAKEEAHDLSRFLEARDMAIRFN